MIALIIGVVEFINRDEKIMTIAPNKFHGLKIIDKTKPFIHRGLTLAWEIAIVLVLKFILLWLLWHFFFSAPQAKHMQVPEQQVNQHLLKISPQTNHRLS